MIQEALDIEIIGVEPSILNIIKKKTDLPEDLLQEIMKYNVLTIQQCMDITGYGMDKVSNAMRYGVLDYVRLFPNTSAKRPRRYIVRNSKFAAFLEESLVKDK